MDTAMLLDDVKFAEAMLEKEKLSNSDIVFILRNIFKMKYYPVAVKFFYSQDELDDFKKNTEYKVAHRGFTFCHYVALSRQKGDIALGTEDKLGCTNAKYVFHWKDLDEAEIKSHRKYTKDLDQAKRFLLDKKVLKPGLLAFATAPLHKAPYKPDVIHGMCDVLQSYHLGNDWCSAFDSHPFHMTMTMNSSVCNGVSTCYVTGKPNITPMCSSSYTSGKTEQGEINYVWPGDHMEPTVRWTLERVVRDGGASYPRTGETYPGQDVCKLCSFLIWKKGKEE